MRMLTVLKSEAENSNILKLRQDMQGNARFAIDSQGHIRTSDSDPRTGTFSEMRVTARDILCSVKGV